MWEDYQLIVQLNEIFHITCIVRLLESHNCLYIRSRLIDPRFHAVNIDHRPTLSVLVAVSICMHRSLAVIISQCLVYLRPLVVRESSVWRGKCHRVQSEQTLPESVDVLFTVVVPGPASRVASNVLKVFIAHIYSLVTRVSI